uniref:Secreted protein n=1 Tax=Panagrellus redivivus TaxID=6233 RepID=A0A7E5A0R5_PANRE
MRVLSLFVPLVLLVSPILAFETPGVEVVILIKATLDTVDKSYFTNTLLPYVERVLLKRRRRRRRNA